MHPWSEACFRRVGDRRPYRGESFGHRRGHDGYLEGDSSGWESENESGRRVRCDSSLHLLLYDDVSVGLHGHGSGFCAYFCDFPYRSWASCQRRSWGCSCADPCACDPESRLSGSSHDRAGFALRRGPGPDCGLVRDRGRGRGRRWRGCRLPRPAYPGGRRHLQPRPGGLLRHNVTCFCQHAPVGWWSILFISRTSMSDDDDDDSETVSTGSWG